MEKTQQSKLNQINALKDNIADSEGQCILKIKQGKNTEKHQSVVKPEITSTDQEDTLSEAAGALTSYAQVNKRDYVVQQAEYEVLNDKKKADKPMQRESKEDGIEKVKFQRRNKSKSQKDKSNTDLNLTQSLESNDRIQSKSKDEITCKSDDSKQYDIYDSNSKNIV